LDDVELVGGDDGGRGEGTCGDAGPVGSMDCCCGDTGSKPGAGGDGGGGDRGGTVCVTSADTFTGEAGGELR
jgi:hypothetical protein